MTRQALNAEQAVAGRPATVSTETVLAAIVSLGISPEVVGSCTAVRLLPDRIEIEVALTAMPGVPTMTMRVPVERER